MANLIDSTYFIGDINLPTSKYDDLTTFIIKFEKDFLIKCFGYTLYKLIAVYDVSTSEQRIKDIVEGKEFTSDPYTYKWNGLKNTDLISPIAYYVYYKYMKSKQTHTSTKGEGKDIDLIDGNIKLVKAWQFMYGLVGNYSDYTVDSLYYFMSQNLSIYPEWQFEGFENINSFDI